VVSLCVFRAPLQLKDFLDGAYQPWCLQVTISFLVAGLPEMLAGADAQTHGGTVFGYRVSIPNATVWLILKATARQSHHRKPTTPPSDYGHRALAWMKQQLTTRAPYALSAVVNCGNHYPA
jgi:glucose-1-phosphate thymidylyltransferase